MDIPERQLEPPEPEAAPCCPCCGEECETLYRDRAGLIVGCENCMETLDAFNGRVTSGDEDPDGIDTTKLHRHIGDGGDPLGVTVGAGAVGQAAARESVAVRAQPTAEHRHHPPHVLADHDVASDSAQPSSIRAVDALLRCEQHARDGHDKNHNARGHARHHGPAAE